MPEDTVQKIFQEQALPPSQVSLWAIQIFRFIKVTEDSPVVYTLRKETDLH